MSNQIYLFDTTVFIDFLRGNDNQAKTWMQGALDGNYSAGVSVITDLELWIGVRNNVDEKRHKLLLARFRRFQMNVTIARQSGKLIQPFFKSDKNCLRDIIIAATAEYYHADLVTRNPAHFRRIPLNGISIISYT